MGIRTVGVYSDADRNAEHVSAVDEAVHIGASPATESYLNQQRVIDAAISSGADSIHPGYGFHSEKADFAERVVASGLTWVGPPAKAIAAMGSKTGARDLMIRAGVPVVPGTTGAISKWEDAREFAKKHGYPILLKAVAGGGGKGMRVVEHVEDLQASFEGAQREALSAFADSSIYVEKYLKSPRHIEIQILADSHGNCVHLGERECTLQRRHQKIIEESPSIAVNAVLRSRIGETAVAAAKACDYVNAGTIECLLDTTGNFYFLEMNTRLQVEHPVTEEVMGIDLVRLQLHIADGGRLPFTQDEIQPRGHAIEVRIYAEDVVNGFLPSTGLLKRLRPPSGPGIREDSGMAEGSEVSRYYDPMISKLIAFADSREAAIQRMTRALKSYEVAGVRTNISFCRHIIESKQFASGEFHTHSADREFLDSFTAENSNSVDNELFLAAMIAEWALRSRSSFNQSGQSDGTSIENAKAAVSNWKVAGRSGAMRSH